MGLLILSWCKTIKQITFIFQRELSLLPLKTHSFPLPVAISTVPPSPIDSTEKGKTEQTSGLQMMVRKNH